MTEKPEASVLTARRATQHFRLSSRDDACEHLNILIMRSSLGPSPPNAGRYTVASRFRCRSCERGYIFPRAPERFVTSPLCLVGYARWDARSDRVPPLQTIIFSSFTGRTPVQRLGVRGRRDSLASAEFHESRSADSFRPACSGPDRQNRRIFQPSARSMVDLQSFRRSWLPHSFRSSPCRCQFTTDFGCRLRSAIISSRVICASVLLPIGDDSPIRIKPT